MKNFAATDFETANNERSGVCSDRPIGYVVVTEWFSGFVSFVTTTPAQSPQGNTPAPVGGFWPPRSLAFRFRPN